MCQYRLKGEMVCKEKAFNNTNYCILHTSFPDNRETEAFKQIDNLKKLKIQEKIQKADYNFTGAIISDFQIQECEITGTINFAFATVDSIFFAGVEVKEHVIFTNLKTGSISFYNSDVSGEIQANGAMVEHGIYFTNIEASEISFMDSNVNGNVEIKNFDIQNHVYLNKIKVKGHFDISYGEVQGISNFVEAEVLGNVSFIGVKFGSGFDYPEEAARNRRIIESSYITDFSLFKTQGELILNSNFCDFESTEHAYRLVRINAENHFDYSKVDFYYFKEMEAIRKQKKWYVRYPEYFIQLLFAYGTRPLRVIIVWFIVVFGLALWYWKGNGISNVKTYLDGLYFSIVTATTLGFGDSTPKVGIFKALVSFEAIFGTFMWAAFITIFSRKYMR
jgi:hypothetical protein